MTKTAISLISVLEDDAKSSKEVVIDLADVRWHVGETMYLHPVDDPAIRYSVRLIGFIKNKTVSVTAPATDGRFDFIRDGQAFLVRAFMGKRAYAFTASAVKSVHSPYPYLHLSYPKEVKCTMARRNARAKVKIISSVSLGEPERTGAVTLTDLSMGGTSGVLKQMLGKKDEEGWIKFKVHAAGQNEYLNLKTVLRSVTPNETGDGFKHGFEFLDMSIHERLVLSAFVRQTLAEAE